MTTKLWDVFISHASEDKDTFVRPLAIALRGLGVSVWYDEFALQPGDSLSRSIDKGLAGSTYGLVVISQAFIRKRWPQYELQGLVSREISEDKVIIPVWHGTTRDEVVAFSPTLADKLAIDTSGVTAQDVAIRILKIVRPDLYARHPRSELERLTSGEAVRLLQQELERVRQELARTKEELSQFQCPVCQAPVIEQILLPASEESGVGEVFACGYESIDGHMERPCPSDPRFPGLEDYELRTYFNEKEPHWRWSCLAIPKTGMAPRVHLDRGLGTTEEEAKQIVVDSYRRVSRAWMS